MLAPPILPQVQLYLTALYLPGLARPASPTNRHWPQLLSTFLHHGADISTFPHYLARHGYHAESLCLSSTPLLDSATTVLQSDRALTPAHPGYPLRWLQILDHQAPPALWSTGPIRTSRCFAIVGGRCVPDSDLSFAAQAANQARLLGYSVISGGAMGCDSAADACLTILPYGIQHHQSDLPAISPFSPSTPFTGQLAMRRKILIYAASEATLIVRARFKQGGTWGGAQIALQRKLCQLLVQNSSCLAHRSLIALGATPLYSPTDIQSALQAPKIQPALFPVQ